MEIAWRGQKRKVLILLLLTLTSREVEAQSSATNRKYKSVLWYHLLMVSYSGKRQTNKNHVVKQNYIHEIHPIVGK